MDNWPPEPPTGYIHIGIDWGQRLSFWEKLCLFFARGKWAKDGDRAVFFKVINGRYFMIDELPRRKNSPSQTVKEK